MNCLKRVFRQRGRICDCAVLWKDEGFIAAVELKGGRKNVNISQIVEQLQKGFDLLEQVTASQQVENFVPILLYRGRRDPTPALRDKRIRFRGNKRRIVARPCGSRLTSILADIGPIRGRRASRR